jgi:hypothetical protein
MGAAGLAGHGDSWIGIPQAEPKPGECNVIFCGGETRTHGGCRRTTLSAWPGVAGGDPFALVDPGFDITVDIGRRWPVVMQLGKQ